MPIGQRQMTAQAAPSRSRAADNTFRQKPTRAMAADVLQRAQAKPTSLSPADVHLLQRTVGNRATMRLLGPLLTATNRTAAQRETAKAETEQTHPPHGLAGGEVDAGVENAIQRAKGGGRALDGRAQRTMEAGLGAHFGGVRVHTDAQADTLSRSLNAKAFTTGKDIFFGKGQYNPNSSSGQELLAHELTHTVQQGGADGAMQRASRIQRFTDDDAKPGGHPNWAAETVSVAKSAGGQASGVFFPKDANDNTLVIKPEYADNDVRPTTSAQMQFADKALSKFGFMLPDSRIVNAGNGEFTEIVNVIGSDNPQRLVLPNDVQDPAGTVQRIKTRLAAAKYLKVMTSVRGRSWEQVVEGVRSQQEADDFVALLSGNGFAFVKNMGKLLVADALIGNDDRASYNDIWKKFGMNMGNLMLTANNQMVLIDSDAAIGDLQGAGSAMGGAFQTPKGQNSPDLLNPLFDNLDMFASTFATKHIRATFVDQIRANKIAPGFDILGYFDNWTSQNLPALVDAFKQGVATGLGQVNTLFSNKQQMTELKTEGQTFGTGEQDELWATFKSRGKYLMSRDEGLGKEEALAQSALYQQYKFGGDMAPPDIGPLDNALLQIQIPKEPKGIEKITWKANPTKSKAHESAREWKDKVRNALEKGKMSKNHKILDASDGILDGKLANALENIQYLDQEIAKRKTSTRSVQKVQFLRDCYALCIETQKKHGEISARLSELRALTRLAALGGDSKEARLIQQKLTMLLESDIYTILAEQAEALLASIEHIQTALARTNPKFAAKFSGIAKKIGSASDGLVNERLGILQAQRKQKRRRMRIPIQMNADLDNL